MVSGTSDGETVTRAPLAMLCPSHMVVIVPREQAEKFESLAEEFAAVPGCRVILDRREAERRREPGAWESGERRSYRLDQSASFVVVVC